MNTLFDLLPVQRPEVQKRVKPWKMIYVELLKGGSIEYYGRRVKVRDAKRNPIKIVHKAHINALKDLIKPNPRFNSFVLNRKYIRSLSKRYWVKKVYLIFLRKKQTDGLR